MELGQNMENITGNLLNISTEEIYGAEIGFDNGLITCIKPVEGDFNSLILPGFIDSHIHIESSMLCPSRFAEAVVPHGTCSVVADPHEIANVMGLEGIRYMLKDVSSVPLKMFLTAPSCVPATSFETSGAKISKDEIKQLLKIPEIVALGEMMNFPGVINEDVEVIEKIEEAKKYNKPIDGHSPLLSGKDLCKYIMAGISTDHECTSKAEAEEKKRLGMKIMLREGSSAKNLEELADVGGEFLVSDDKHPEDLINGHVDEMLRKAVEYGIDGIDAIKMVTLNPSEHYKLETGNIMPGKAADFVIVDDLDNLKVKKVLINGKLVAKNGKALFKVNPIKLPNTFQLKPKKPADFNIAANGSHAKVKAIEVVEDQLITNEKSVDLKIIDGFLEADLTQDVIKIAVVERYGHERINNGFLKGFGMKYGAIASSVAHDSHNIIVVGTNNHDMSKAVNTVLKNKGGLSVVFKNNVKYLELPIAGLMSTNPLEKVANNLRELHKTVEDLGVKIPSPFMTMSFLALLVIPSLKISDKGLFDVNKFKFVDLIENEYDQ
jgi:adenine deaminase